MSEQQPGDEQMEIVVIGAGAMGCLFGAWLSRVARVRLYDIDPDTVEAINRQGVVVTTMAGEERRYPLEAVSRFEEGEPPAELVILFTKSRGTRAAAELAKKILAEEGLVLTLQNGVGNLEQIEAVFGRPCGVAGVTAQAGTVIAPGHSLHAGEGETLLGPAPGQEKQLQAVEQLFARAGITSRISGDASGLIWGKLLVNVGINALAAILRVPNGVLAQVPECSRIMELAVAEGVAVARALGIRLPYEDPMAQVLKVCADTAANRASMLQDILRRAPTEIDVINGAIVARGREVGVATPVNGTITMIIKALEASHVQRLEKS
ncbi:ketopantoate reductase family protein [Desulfogranum mediterraneum]|uniref:ketopantoate reductase family protein n=1 Tax=Desulfogranum mediterraneum TaxID=160661 RepID=UPI0003F7A98B|nr:ketopantoate reductase family protein [Desulfogranum mediterraneum]